MQITADMFSNPDMRPHLEKYYNHKKDEFAKALEEREPIPETVTMADGTKMTPLQLTPDMMVPFDKWLELMQEFDLFSSLKTLEQAREHLETLEAQNPDGPANIDTVFSNDGKILAYLTKDGGLVMHSDIALLNGLTQKDDIIARLKTRYPHLDVTEYTAQTQPTKREFASTWYPHNNIDADYRAAITAAKDHLKSMQEWAANVQKNHDAMRAFLLESMQAA